VPPPVQEPASPDAPPLFEAEAARERRSKHFARAAIIGLGAGLLAVLFRGTLTLAEHSRDSLLTSLHNHPSWGWAILPLIGLILGSLTGWAVLRWSPESSGSGIPHVKGVLLNVRKMRWATLVPVKFLGGVAVIGSGLSLGREGPTVQMGAAVGACIGRILKVRQRSMPQLIAAGSGAGLAAAFNAPLAGFIFVLEELQRELSPLTYGGALVAAVCADIVTRSILGQDTSLRVGAAAALPMGTLPLVVLLGGIAGVLGVAFNQCLLAAQRRAGKITEGVSIGRARLRIPAWLLPGIAGIIVGLIAWWLPDAIGGGHPVAERLSTNAYAGAAIGALALLLIAKFGATVLSYASGAPGGIFAPMLVLGALVGLILQRTGALIWPSLADLGPSFAVLGMAAFFASSVRAPLTGIVLILEMTGNYQLLFALSVVCLVSYLVADSLGDRPIYDALLERDLLLRGHGRGEVEPTHVTIGIQHSSVAAGKTIRQVGFPAGCLVVALERRGRHLAPTASAMLEPGDHITVLVPGDQPGDAVQVVALCRIN